MLERQDGELQRELSHLLTALIQLQPLLRSLQLEVSELSIIESKARIPASVTLSKQGDKQRQRRSKNLPLDKGILLSHMVPFFGDHSAQRSAADASLECSNGSMLCLF